MWLREVITKNWEIKLLSLTFAIILWFFVVGEEKAEVGFSIPLEIVNVPQHLVIANDIPNSIIVRVYGPRSMVRALASQSKPKLVDLKGYTAGDHIYRFTPDSLNLTGNIKVIRIQPSQIHIILAPLVTREIPIRPVIKGRPAPNYRIEGITIKPRSIDISGPKNEMERLKYIKTMPIYLNNTSSTITRKVELDFGSLHCTTSEATSEITVTVKIAPKISTIKINHVQVKMTPQYTNSHIWPRQVSVIVEGPITKLQSLDPSNINVFVPASPNKLSPGIHYITLKAKPMQGIIIKKIIPKEVRVTIKRKRTLSPHKSL